MSEQMNPCPFCGSDDVRVYLDASSDRMSDWDNHAECKCCGAQGPHHKDEPEAIAAWNRRAAPTEPAVDRDAVLEEAARIVDEWNATVLDRFFVANAIRYLKVAAPAAPAVPSDVHDLNTTQLDGQNRPNVEHKAVPAAPPKASEQDDGAEPSWRTVDISWICMHLTENTHFSGARLQREWNAMKAIALAAIAQPSPSVDQAKRLVGGEVATVNDIPATIRHDEGAIARCFYCSRYSLDPATLSDRAPLCDCGRPHGWSGSFKKPGADAKWSGKAPDRASTGSATSTDTKEKE